MFTLVRIDNKYSPQKNLKTKKKCLLNIKTRKKLKIYKCVM